MNGIRVTLLSAVTAALFSAVSMDSEAATVFRCAQPDGSVLYTDMPCPGGGPIEIHPGKADPAAAERLARAQSALDTAAAQRKSDLAREAAQREQYAQMRAATAASAAAAVAPQGGDAGGGGGYGYGYGYGADYGYVYASVYGSVTRPPRPLRPPRPRPPLPEKRVVPAQARNLPTINIPDVPDGGRTRR